MHFGEYLPEIYGVAGGVTGYAFDKVAAKYAAIKDMSVIQSWGPMEPPATAKELKNHNNIETHFRAPASLILRTLSSIALAASAAGVLPFAIGKRVQNNNPNQPVLVEVLDRSGQTQFDGTDNKISIVNSAFINANSMKVDTILARGGSYTGSPLTPGGVAGSGRYSPTGEVSVAQAVTPAIREASLNAVKVVSSEFAAPKQETSAVLIVTDDNSVGNATNIVQSAQSSKTKIFIANVGQQNDSTAQQLQDIAKATGGEYWNASVNTAKVAKDIATTISPTLSNSKYSQEKPNDVLLVLDALAWMGLIGMTINTAGLVYKRREDS